MIFFVAHDPGAKNHIHPIYEHALGMDEAARLVDLSECSDLPDTRKMSVLLPTMNPKVLVAGCSMNGFEWPFLLAAKALGIPRAMVVDFGVGRRLQGFSPGDYPDRFLVTNEGCRRELIAMGAAPDSVKLTGSAHLEKVSKTMTYGRSASVWSLYHLNTATNIIPFFCAADAFESAKALQMLATLLATSSLAPMAVVVRPHPRSSSLKELASVARQFSFLHLDRRNCATTPMLLLASRFSFSMGSTVSLESQVLGTPSAFFQVGWDYNELEHLYQNVLHVPRVRSANDLQNFVFRAVNRRSKMDPGDVEHHLGALGRSWGVICDLLQSMRPRGG